MKGKYIGESDPLYCINGKIYDILGEAHGMYKVIDETGEDYFYVKDDLEIVEEDDIDLDMRQ